MEKFFVVLVVALTSYGTYLLGKRTFALQATSLHEALSIAFECIGAVIVFLLINTALGLSIVLLFRSLTSQFISVYAMGDIAWVILSVFQGVIFQLWWRTGPGSTRAG